MRFMRRLQKNYASWGKRMGEKDGLHAIVQDIRRKFVRVLLRTAHKFSHPRDFVDEINELVRCRLPRNFIVSEGAALLTENLCVMAREDAVLRRQMVTGMMPRLFSILYPMALDDESLREFLGAEGLEDLHRHVSDIAIRLELPILQRQPVYSQEGEDLFVTRLFDGQKTGFYVDVGACHPFRFSNTYLLYLNGWRGINIDAMPGSMAAFRKLRPRDINIECLISRDRKPLRFFQYDEPALNTVEEDVVKKREVESPQHRVKTITTLEPRPLSEVLAEQMPAGQVIDMMSIDAEGHDMDVLESNDWARFRPRVLIVELISTSFDDMQATSVYKFLTARGYHLRAKLFNSAIFLQTDGGADLA